MARQTGNLLQALSKLAHHVEPDKVEPLFGSSTISHVERRDMVRYRFELVRSGIVTVRTQLERVRAMAEIKGYQEILDILDEQVEIGHNM